MTEEEIKALRKHLKKMGYTDEEIDDILDNECIEDGWI